MLGLRNIIDLIKAWPWLFIPAFLIVVFLLAFGWWEKHRPSYILEGHKEFDKNANPYKWKDPSDYE